MSMSDLFTRSFEDIRGGETFVTRGRTVCEADVSAFAGLTGDRHPVHTDAVWAAESSFGERIAHGLLVAGIAVGLLPLDPERVIALRRVRDLVCKRPVLLGDTVHVQGSVVQTAPLRDDSGLVMLDLQIRKQDGTLAIRMAVDMLWRRDAAPDGAAPAAGALDALLTEFVPIPL
jgi:acyl dehydratase